eukprot:COSAG02_NODE_64553_length_260_cov_0.645963_1_plen_36_part_10
MGVAAVECGLLRQSRSDTAGASPSGFGFSHAVSPVC